MTNSAALPVAQPATPAAPPPAGSKDKPRYRIVLERFLRHRLAVLGLAVLTALMVCCFGAHWMLVVAVAVILFNLLADLAYALLDPRVALR